MMTEVSKSEDVSAHSKVRLRYVNVCSVEVYFVTIVYKIIFTATKTSSKMALTLFQKWSVKKQNL